MRAGSSILIPHPHRRAGRAAPRIRAFTIVEILVVIAVISLLISITLPALAMARRSGAQTRETAALKHTSLAYLTYAQDHRGALLPGFLPLEWVTPGGDPALEIKVFSSDSAGQARLYGSVARRYPWRLAPYLGYSREALVVDSRLRSEFLALPDRPDTRDGFQWAFAANPSFGFNSTYVGGDARRSGFFPPAFVRWGKFCVTKIDEPRHPNRLMTFATARGNHPLIDSKVVPGRHRIEGPWKASREVGQVPTFSSWEAPPGAFDPNRSPSTYGHLDFRHFNRVTVTTFDGHVEPLSLDDVRDMRWWCNLATSADWQPR